MARLLGTARLIVPACQAKPSPKIGQALGPLAVNMMQFCQEFNEKTNEYQEGIPMRVKLQAYEDRTFQFQLGYPANSWFIKKVVGIEKGSARTGRDIVGSITLKQIYEIAEVKHRDELSWGGLNTSVEGVCRSLVGTCASMGVSVVNDLGEGGDGDGDGNPAEIKR